MGVRKKGIKKMNTMKFAVMVALVLSGCSQDEAKNDAPAAASQRSCAKSTTVGETCENKVRASLDEAARVQIRTLDDAVVIYKLKHNGKLPNSLKDLIDDSGDGDPILSGGEKSIRDPWGNDCRLEKTGRKYIVVSAGPNGVFGDDDDIRSDAAQRR